jgi:3-deoxy-manno-octulosonate cytidylyltransferase (CMP-KDO synthetase)
MGCPSSGLALVIPARLASSRLPRKLLLTVSGRTILEWTHRRAVAACGAASVWVATDSEEIAGVVAGFGGQVLRTGPQPSGTHRVAAAVALLPAAPRWVINLQGDEPLVEPRAIAAVAERLAAGGEALVTCAAPLPSRDAWLDPNVVKVVCRADRSALYFSRHPIPGSLRGTGPEAFAAARRQVHQHVGIYGFPAALLQRYVELAPTPLAEIEALEQLRALEAGIRIEVVAVAAAPAVDTAEDFERVRRRLASAEDGAEEATGR